MTVTAQMQYDANYPINGIDARQDNIIVRKSTNRNYGYELFNRRVNKRFFWYKFKSDAIKKILEIKIYN